MTETTTRRRRELVASARQRITKILAPDTTRIGATILAEDALADLDAAITIEERATRHRPQPGRRDARNGL